LHGLQIDKWRADAPVNILDLSPENVRFLASQGFNLARVSMTYSGVEPAPGQFDQGYVGAYRAFDTQLANAGVYDLLDMMQGEFSQAVGGWGMPDWMTNTSGLPNSRDPYPRGYYSNPAENAAWDNFYANVPASDGVGLQDHYAAGLRRISAGFADAPALLAIDVLNEPWPGTPWASCALPTGCPPGGFDQTSLTDFYKRVVPAIRSADPRHMIAYEPNLLFDFGAATGLGNLNDPNLLFAFHNYCLGTVAFGFTVIDPVGACGVGDGIVFANAESRAAASGDGLLMDEWGNTTDTAAIARIAGEADQSMVGWSDWAYEDCCMSGAAVLADGTKPATGSNVRLPILRALVRPYPQAVAGTPQGWSYDPSSDRFHLTYSAAGVSGALGSDVTQIEVPPLQYPTGYDADVKGGRVSSAPDADPLLIDTDTAHGVEVTGTPARHHPRSSGIPGKCSGSARTLKLRGRRAGRAINVVVYVNGKATLRRRGHDLRRIRVPAGLTNGSRIKIVSRTARGAKVTTRRKLRDCRLTHPRTRIRHHNR